MSHAHGRIVAIDFVRVCAVVLVVIVHLITQPIVYNTVPSGALAMLLHVSREIFLIITGLVLAHTSSRFSGFGWLRFYWRRLPLVVIPYAAWTLLYMLNNHLPLHPFLSNYINNLRTGEASYQLYFLIVTMKLYLVFPCVHWVLQQSKKYHGVILSISGIVQVAVLSAIRYGWLKNIHYFSVWFAKPEADLLTYQFYVITGCIAALHLNELIAWSRQHFWTSILFAVEAFGLGLYLYFWQLGNGLQPVDASSVFQPVVAIMSLAAILALFAVAVRWSDSGAPGQTHVLKLADVSFGIYLSHVLIISILTTLATNAHIPVGAETIPVWQGLIVILFIATPVTYLLTAGVVTVLRYTPFSYILTGRPMLRITSRNQVELETVIEIGKTS